jgi:Ni/Co efflux regulator RcnB
MVMASAGAALMLTTAAAGAQQRVVQRGPGAAYPMPTHQMHARPNMPMPQVPRGRSRGARWGSKIGGQWWGGVNAPGGWAAYRQPFRGYRLPTYWVAPRFYVTDWSYYGLPAPVSGYNWVRYYDDAVMVDRQGAVYDHRGAIDWEREHEGRSGAGGAIAGAVVGGVAGNVIAGRGDKLAGTLLGAGVGAAAGYGTDRATDTKRGRHEGMDHRDGYAGRDGHDGREGYDEPPMAPDYPPEPGMRERREVIIHRRGPDYPPPPMGGPGGWTSRDGRTTVVTSGGYGGSYQAAPGAPVIVTAPYGSVTTVTVQSAPVVTTTTTTEIIEEDSVTWTRPTVIKRKVYAGKRVWRAKGKLRPRCVCR